MASISFPELLEIYRNTRFSSDCCSGKTHIANKQIYDTLKTIESDENACQDSNIVMIVPSSPLELGQYVELSFKKPRLGLGILANTFDELLNSPGAWLAEPNAYFVIRDCIWRDMAPPSDRLVSYRAALDVVALIKECAPYADQIRQDLVFFDEGKFLIPVRYDSAVLDRLSVSDVNRLQVIFTEQTNRAQQLEILTKAVIDMSRAQSPAKRFSFILENITALADEVRDGYRLFISSFSYKKIRSEIENAKLEYITKIHKTIVDIQGQLLGIPLATVIVASQLKTSNGCNQEFWADSAVILGAWVFVILLMAAIYNQWVTLDTISAEIDRQRETLIEDFSSISKQFTDIFAFLKRRIFIHRVGLVTVTGIAIIGAFFATVVFSRVVSVNAFECLTAKISFTTSK